MRRNLVVNMELSHFSLITVSPVIDILLPVSSTLSAIVLWVLGWLRKTTSNRHGKIIKLEVRLSSAYHQGLMLTLWEKRMRIIDQDSGAGDMGLQYSDQLAYKKPHILSTASHLLGVMMHTYNPSPRVGNRSMRRPRSSSALYRVRSKPVAHEINS